MKSVILKTFNLQKMSTTLYGMIPARWFSQETGGAVTTVGGLSLRHVPISAKLQFQEISWVRSLFEPGKWHRPRHHQIAPSGLTQLTHRGSPSNKFLPFSSRNLAAADEFVWFSEAWTFGPVAGEGSNWPWPHRLQFCTVGQQTQQADVHVSASYSDRGATRPRGAPNAIFLQLMLHLFEEHWYVLSFQNEDGHEGTYSVI